MRTTNAVAGDRGEEIARRFLKQRGFEIIELKYRFGRGEIDIIARNEGVLVFCEVKTRYNDAFGEPEYALTLRKQEQIRRVARGYLYEHGIGEQECRFDVIAIQMGPHSPDIRYIPNAF
jgi:putative endonuclease